MSSGVHRGIHLRIVDFRHNRGLDVKHSIPFQHHVPCLGRRCLIEVQQHVAGVITGLQEFQSESPVFLHIVILNREFPTSAIG